MPAGLALDAARSRPAISSRGLLETLFAKAFDGLVYPQIWEDPVVDLEALDLAPGSTIMSIASGGCNVMSYLMARPAKIIAVDLSPAHVALLRLKIKAAHHLAHDDFFELFGRAQGAGNVERYMRLRPELDAETRAFWDGRSASGRRRFLAFKRGFYRTGMLGNCIGFGHALVKLHGRDPRKLLKAADVEEQRRIFENEIAPLFEKPLPRLLAKLPIAFFGLGIPPAQFDAMKGDARGGGMAELVRERVRRLACDFPFSENYYAWQAFGRTYANDRSSLPPYLEERNFPIIQENADRIEPNLEPFTQRLGRAAPRSIDAFVLLDAQDWMTDHQTTMLWAAINRAAAPGARVIFRTAAAETPLPRLLPRTVLEPWIYEADRSLELHKRDRSAIYGGFHLYRLRP